MTVPSILVTAALAAMTPVLVHADDSLTHSPGPRLPDLLRRSALVVLADVGAITEQDEGRLLQAHLRVSQQLKGTMETGDLKVIEQRNFPSVPPVLRTGRRVVALLEPAPVTSQLRRSLPQGAYYSLLAERWGLIDLPDADTERAVLEAVGGWVTLARDDEQDESQRAASVRRLVFLELGARNERLVEDGTTGLADLSGLEGSLTAAEQDIIARTLRREELPERIRIALVETIAQARLRSLAPVLSDLPGAGPELLRASIAARVRLGATRKSADLVAALRDDDPAARLAAIHELTESGPSGTLAEVADLAVSDPARDVRLAAIEALEKAGSPEVLPALGKTFSDADPGIRQRSAQAIHQIGGREAASLLADLAFTGPSDAQRQAVVLLIALGISRDDPLITRIRDTHPNQAIRDLAAHGLPFEAR